MLASSTPDALWRAPSLRVLRPAAVVCRDVSYRRLLRRCSLEVPVGMRLMLVGEPDAGASALVRILAGLSRPRSGSVRIAGMDTPSAAGWGRRVAHLGPRPGLPVWMTPREALALAAELQGLPPAELARRTERVLAWARLPATLMDRPMRREGPPLLERTALATALLGDPEVLLMDEPLRSIDPEERTGLLRLPGQRRTVVIASRSPASDAAVVGHVALVRGGRIAHLARIEDLEAIRLPVSVQGIADLAARRSRTPDAASARR